LELSPCNCHVLPDWSVREKLPLDPLKQPWTVCAPPCDPELELDIDEEPWLAELCPLWSAELALLELGVVELWLAELWSCDDELLVEDCATASVVASASTVNNKTAFFM
jgi:hypothetical protein